MGGKTPTKKPRREGVKDAGGGSEGIVGGGEAGRKVEGEEYQGRRRGYPAVKFGPLCCYPLELIPVSISTLVILESKYN